MTGSVILPITGAELQELIATIKGGGIQGTGVTGGFRYVKNAQGKLELWQGTTLIATQDGTGSWFKTAVSTGVGSIHLGGGESSDPAHSVSSIGQNVSFKNEAFNLNPDDAVVWFPGWQGVTVDLSSTLPATFLEFGAVQPAFEVNGSVQSSSVLFDFVTTIASNICVSEITVRANESYTGRVTNIIRSANKGVDVHESSRVISITAGQTFTIKYPSLYFARQGDQLRLIMRKENGSPLSVRAGSTNTSHPWRSLKVRPFVDVAPAILGVDGKLALNQLPDSILAGLKWQGTWNAATNTPAIPAAATGNNGWLYKASVAGTSSITGSPVAFGVGDWLISNGTVWQRVPNTLPLINDLTTGGVSAALTAEQGKVLKSQVDNRAPLVHTHTASQVTGLGTAATATVMTSLTDTTTPNALMPRGAFGVGNYGVNNPILPDLNTVDLVTGFYTVTAATANSPHTGAAGVVLITAYTTASGYQARQMFLPVIGDDVYTRERYGSTWQPWRKIYQNSNILGTVSQTGGVPTGAIIQRGGNANGQFVRYADGTQICWSIIASGTTPSAPMGSIFTTNSQVWTFPIAFVDANVSFHVNEHGGVGRTWAGLGDSGVTSLGASYIGYRAVSNGAPMTFSVLAIGRWF